MAERDSSGCRKKSPVKLRELIFVSASIFMRKNFPPGTFFMASYFTSVLLIADRDTVSYFLVFI